MKFRLLAMLAVVASPAAAQNVPTPAPKPTLPLQVGNGPKRMPAAPREYTSAKDIAARIAAADAAVAAGRPYDGEPLLFQQGHRVTMEYRNVPQGGINVHLEDAEMFVIISGTGAMTVGGHLIDPVAQKDNPYEGPTISSRKVEGARTYEVGPGDMIMIPANTPHTVSRVDGKLVLYSMILPRPARPVTDIPLP
ncbi:hypothetical protein EOE18_16860 [Novosphingobium umbonatum]|uniref:Cupin domain-containing protein n=1 Tax=Novosphingobium umbonatum TaxID=1908524 RepID=A0A3S2Y6C8_9SPHN|nr:hypothetical protein [Novosphingobium umbonatum]RVU03205.1 hypothetical protein EOE18_16860 [Novosphingobium umbonatum]